MQASLAIVGADRPDPGATPAYTPPPRRAGDRFRILRLHARGGLGEVYLARDEELGREVAVKSIQPEKAGSDYHRSKFVLEAEISGGLEHPGIVPIYSLGTYDDDKPYYAMRFIKGDSLKEAAERFHRDAPKLTATEYNLQLREFLGRFTDVCNALHYAHSKGVLHRDLKPHNIMVGQYGETLIIDWGLAKATRKPDPGGSNASVLQPQSGSGMEPTAAGAPSARPAT